MSGTTVTTAQRHMPDDGDVIRHSLTKLFKKGTLQTVLLGIRVINQHCKRRHQYPHQMQSTRMRKSKATSFKGVKHGILQMAGHLLYHTHTSEVQTRHTTSSVSTPIVDITMERAFAFVCELMPSASPTDSVGLSPAADV
jgi:hypothetical protein